MTPEILAVRARLRDDFQFYAQHAIKIRTKEGDIRPLLLNRAQLHLILTAEHQLRAEGRVRIVLLKARQQGLSTVVGARLYHHVSQRPATKAIVVTHHATSTKALFEMTKMFHAQCPEILRPSTKYSSVKELQFDLLNSGYMVATAGGDSIARGETLRLAHISELAFWPRAGAKANLGGLLEAVPNGPGTEVYIESTANGVSGLFYDYWREAVAGKNGYIPVFCPWFWGEGYREPVPPGFIRTPEEEALMAEFGDDGLVDDEQLQFRRMKIAEKGLELFHQEYPATPDEAFLTTGRPVFDPRLLLQERPKTPLSQLALEGEDWNPHLRGELKLYHPVDPEMRYVIGADVGMGVKRDFSVAQVLDLKKRQVAVWRGQVDPDYYATVLLHLGNYFNQARIAVESNNHGILTCSRLGKDFAYPDFYQETVVDKTTEEESTRLGFSTNTKTKPLVIDQLRAALREGEIEINDQTTLDEMRSYIVNESGAMEAERGCYDDCVMSLAIAHHIHEGIWEPIPTEDGHYVDFE